MLSPGPQDGLHQEIYEEGLPCPYAMSTDYQDLISIHKAPEETTCKCVDPEEEDDGDTKMNLWIPQPSSRLLCALCTTCAVLLSIIIILIISFRYPGEKPPDRTLEYKIGNLSNSMNSRVAQLIQDGSKTTEKLQQLNDALKALQADTSISTLQSSVNRALNTLRRLSDQVKKLQVNGSNDFTCPSGWSTFQSSCYFAPFAGKSWSASKKFCEDKDSHLVVINTEEEQDFVFSIMKGKYTWIGLTDVSGDWKWVDGTDYNSAPKNWIPGQPDEYYGHGLGGGEDCAHLHRSGQWNDDHCSREYNYLCEMDMI
ncbi:PREDICTED: asialoglycoprotein receptor 1-like [Nanorana parkeri]|uniref:asialoglycoprotein receptor 1-like n=1 Tax=Nanorana parkeri TaxID=125878 RepID=UPI0008549CCB|nr:PREDICTED: asialoglycoprotein receptor 1-like [Nanorana parkeri]